MRALAVELERLTARFERTIEQLDDPPDGYSVRLPQPSRRGDARSAHPPIARGAPGGARVGHLRSYREYCLVVEPRPRPSEI